MSQQIANEMVEGLRLQDGMTPEQVAKELGHQPQHRIQLVAPPAQSASLNFTMTV